MFSLMPHSDLDWYVYAGVAVLALLSGRQKVVRIVAVLAVLTGIGIGTRASWGGEVWPLIGSLAGHVN